MSAFTVTLDCHSPETLAAFWGAALHYRVIHQGPQSVGLGPTAGVTGVLLFLQKVAERKQGKNRMHMDIPSYDLDADRALRRPRIPVPSLDPGWRPRR